MSESGRTTPTETVSDVWSPRSSPRHLSEQFKWPDDVDVSHVCVVPNVTVGFSVDATLLHLGLEVENTDNPNQCEARVLQISLDEVVVARNRGREPLTFVQSLDKLERGKHVIQYVCHFDSGDMVVQYRTLVYRGPTRRASSVPAHTLSYHGSGLVSSGRPVMWRVDEIHASPVTVVLRGGWNSSLYIQSCCMRPGEWVNTPQELRDGEARITISGSGDHDEARFFVVGVHGRDSSEMPYDLFIAEAAGGNPTDWTLSPHTPAHYALCVGISKYTFITPLHWADADAISWLDYLTARSYMFRLFGDGVSSYSPYTPTALGRKGDISSCVRALADVVREGDVVAITDSGHGASDVKSGHSWFICLDDHDVSQRGAYDDIAFADDVSLLTKKGANVFVFIDACHSFGFANELRRRCDPGKWFIATTCTVAGVGYDDSSVQHGSFTYAFLVKGLMERFKNSNPTLGEVFKYARDNYRFRSDPNNMPQCDGNPDIRLM